MLFMAVKQFAPEFNSQHNNLVILGVGIQAQI